MWMHSLAISLFSHGFLMRTLCLYNKSRTGFYYQFLSYCNVFLMTHRRPSSEIEIQRYIYIAISVIGFTVADLFYIAAVINYALQCHLITFLITVTVERICRNCWKVDQAIKVPNLCKCNVSSMHYCYQHLLLLPVPLDILDNSIFTKNVLTCA